MSLLTTLKFSALCQQYLQLSITFHPPTENIHPTSDHLGPLPHLIMKTSLPLGYAPTRQNATTYFIFLLNELSQPPFYYSGLCFVPKRHKYPNFLLLYAHTSSHLTIANDPLPQLVILGVCPHQVGGTLSDCQTYSYGSKKLTIVKVMGLCITLSNQSGFLIINGVMKFTYSSCWRWFHLHSIYTIHTKYCIFSIHMPQIFLNDDAKVIHIQQVTT